jgi:hypothetical protein
MVAERTSSVGGTACRAPTPHERNVSNISIIQNIPTEKASLTIALRKGSRDEQVISNVFVIDDSSKEYITILKADKSFSQKTESMRIMKNAIVKIAYSQKTKVDLSKIDERFKGKNVKDIVYTTLREKLNALRQRPNLVPSVAIASIILVLLFIKLVTEKSLKSLINFKDIFGNDISPPSRQYYYHTFSNIFRKKPLIPPETGTF